MGNKQSVDITPAEEADNVSEEDPAQKSGHLYSSQGRASALLSLPNTAPAAANKRRPPEDSDAASTEAQEAEAERGPGPDEDEAAKQQQSAALPAAPSRSQVAPVEPMYPDDADVVAVMLTRSEAGFGFKFIGPSDSQAMTGVFITHVKPNSPAALCHRLMRAQQILAVNGEDTLLATKQDVQAMLKKLDTVLLEIKYDAAGFAAYDQGEELRRISFMVFADTEDEGEEGPGQVQTFDAHFLGQAPVQDANLAAMQAVYKQVRKKPVKGHKRKLILSVGGMDVRIFELRDKPGTAPSRRHLLIDVLNCIAASNVVAIVSNDIVEGHRQKLCYIYTLRNKKEASRAADLISQRCKAGFSRVQQELSRQRQRTQSMRQSRAKSLSSRQKPNARTRAHTVSNRPPPTADPRNGKPQDAASGAKGAGASGSLSDVVDFRSKPLGDQRWFFSTMSQADAIRVLVERAPLGGFLVFPTGRPQEYEVCVKEGARDIRSLKMIPQVESDGDIYYTLEGQEKLFKSVVLLVWHFGHHSYAVAGDYELRFRLPRRRPSNVREKDAKGRPGAHVAGEALTEQPEEDEEEGLKAKEGSAQKQGQRQQGGQQQDQQQGGRLDDAPASQGGPQDDERDEERKDQSEDEQENQEGEAAVSTQEEGRQQETRDAAQQEREATTTSLEQPSATALKGDTRTTNEDERMHDDAGAAASAGARAMGALAACDRPIGRQRVDPGTEALLQEAEALADELQQQRQSARAERMAIVRMGVALHESGLDEENKKEEVVEKEEEEKEEEEAEGKERKDRNENDEVKVEPNAPKQRAEEEEEEEEEEERGEQQQQQQGAAHVEDVSQKEHAEGSGENRGWGEKEKRAEEQRQQEQQQHEKERDKEKVKEQPKTQQERQQQTEEGFRDRSSTMTHVQDYAMSERKRQLKGANEDETRKRLSTISFDFSFK